MAAPAGPSGVWRAEGERAHRGTQHGSHDALGDEGGGGGKGRGGGDKGMVLWKRGEGCDGIEGNVVKGRGARREDKGMCYGKEGKVERVRK